MSAAAIPAPEDPSDSLSAGPIGPTEPTLPTTWSIAGGRTLALDRPVVMGILNLSPDSFSDGGELTAPDAAVRRAERMIGEGAGILDVGGESTRPGAHPVGAREELERVVPVIEALVSRVTVPISIDTRKARVAEAALAAGASIVNDVSALRHDASMAEVIAERRAGAVLMHMRGIPADMTEHARYDDVMREVVDELRNAVARAESAGIERGRIVVDPGIGFAKNADHSLRVLRELHRMAELGRPFLVGPSRKSFLGEVLGVPPHKRVVGTAAACLLAYRGGARIFRVHDVEATVQALAVAVAVEEA